MPSIIKFLKQSITPICILLLCSCVSETQTQNNSSSSASSVNEKRDTRTTKSSAQNVTISKSQNSRTITSIKPDPQVETQAAEVDKDGLPLKDDYLQVTSGGKNKIYTAKNTHFSSKSKSGETTFMVDGLKVVFPALLKNVRLRGMDSLLGSEFTMLLPDVSSKSELNSKIDKLGPKIPTESTGYHQALEGSFTGASEGRFRLSVFTNK